MSESLKTPQDIPHRPVHPYYGKALSGSSMVVEGVTFHPYRRAICAYTWCSEDFRIAVSAIGPTGSLYCVFVDGRRLERDCRTQRKAALRGISALATTVAKEGT